MTFRGETETKSQRSLGSLEPGELREAKDPGEFEELEKLGITLVKDTAADPAGADN